MTGSCRPYLQPGERTPGKAGTFATRLEARGGDRRAAGTGKARDWDATQCSGRYKSHTCRPALRLGGVKERAQRLHKLRAACRRPADRGHRPRGLRCALGRRVVLLVDSGLFLAGSPVVTGLLLRLPLLVVVLWHASSRSYCRGPRGGGSVQNSPGGPVPAQLSPVRGHALTSHAQGSPKPRRDRAVQGSYSWRSPGDSYSSKRRRSALVSCSASRRLASRIHSPVPATRSVVGSKCSRTSARTRGGVGEGGSPPGKAVSRATHGWAAEVAGRPAQQSEVGRSPGRPSEEHHLRVRTGDTPTSPRTLVG